jgi:cell division protein FtsW (lipid II flippase)
MKVELPNLGPHKKNVLELLLLFFVLWIFQTQANELVMGNVHSLDPKINRYLFETPRDLRAAAFSFNLHFYFQALAFCGWAALLITRVRYVALWAKVAAMAVLWIGFISTAHPYGINGFTFPESNRLAWLALATIATFLVVGLAIYKTRKTTTTLSNEVIKLNYFEAPTSAWHYPAFVLFTALGLIWLLDFSARGYTKLRFKGLEQADTLFLAYLVLTFVVLLSDKALTMFTRLMSYPKAEKWSASALAILLLTLMLVGDRSALGVMPWRGIFKLSASVTSELMRIPLIIATAWLLYRWVESGERASYGVMATILCGLLLSIGHWGTKDLGPLLVVGSALAIASGGFAGWLLSRYSVILGWVSAFAVTLSSGWALYWALFEIGPMLSSTVAARIAALSDPALNVSHYLSELRWFVAGSPLHGYGIGQTPWCGDWGWLGGDCAGVPQQMQSDYVFVAISAVWGSPVAWVIVAALAFWSASFIGSTRTNEKKSTLVSTARLRDCIVSIWALITLTQLFITVFGSIGVLPLTGVTFPLIGFGSSALLSSAAFIGLAMRSRTHTFSSTKQFAQPKGIST